MAVEQPWALDFLSFGLAILIDERIRTNNTIQEEGRGASEEERAPARGVGGPPPHFVAGVSGTD